jgi:hypothetical protein
MEANDLDSLISELRGIREELSALRTEARRNAAVTSVPHYLALGIAVLFVLWGLLIVFLPGVF